MPPISRAPRPPYALEGAIFPLRALAMLAGRSPLGGPREIALACFVAARMVVDFRPPGSAEGGGGGEQAGGVVPLSPQQRSIRAQGARHWLGAAAIPGSVKNVLIRLVDASCRDDPHAITAALESVIAVTASHLDSGSRLELAKLAQAIAE